MIWDVVVADVAERVDEAVLDASAVAEDEDVLLVFVFASEAEVEEECSSSSEASPVVGSSIALLSSST